MKIIIILVVSFNLGYASEYEALKRENRRELQNIIKKYKHLSTGNAEFSQWIEKVYNELNRQSGNIKGKMELVAQFYLYDKERQRLEDQITDRLSKVTDLLIYRRGGPKCVQFYRMQESELKRAFKFSNSRKRTKIDENSTPCPRNFMVKKVKEYDEYDYLNWL
ncbi:uncharacterized protein [Drosophila takahashii]|uniref:uncharacterized protein n=1 Tax=Drosophila takahashii TaxID=29030 RepID=UPI0038995BAF